MVEPGRGIEGTCRELCDAVWPYYGYATSCSVDGTREPMPGDYSLDLERYELINSMGGAGGEGGAGPGGDSGSEPGGSYDHAVTLLVHCTLKVSEDGCEGRRHVSWVNAPEGRGASGLARYLGRAASAEAASVATFHHLCAEVAACGAPAALVKRTQEAAQEEVGHARMMEALARRFGGRPSPVATSSPLARSLLDLALENAVEGCAHEAFAALTALYQAKHAQDPEVQRIMRHIAQDEMGHAQLAWELHLWLVAQLSPEEQSGVNQALSDAIDRLCALDQNKNPPISDELCPADRSLLGLPEPQHVSLLAQQMRAALSPYVMAA